MPQEPRTDNPWADDELPIRTPGHGHPNRGVLLTIVGLAVAVGLLGGTLVTFLALRGEGEPTRTSSSAATSRSQSPTSSPAGDLTPSANRAGAELTHLPVGRVPDVRTRRNGDPVEVTFINRSPRAVQVQWVDTEGKLVPYSQLAAGEQVAQPTFATHPWVVTDSAGTPLLLVIAGEQPGTVTVGG